MKRQSIEQLRNSRAANASLQLGEVKTVRRRYIEYLRRRYSTKSCSSRMLIAEKSNT